MNAHPNTVASGKASIWSGATAWVVLYANNRWGWHIDAKWAVAAAITFVGSANAARLYIGQRGLIPVVKGLYHKYVTGTAK